MNPTDPLYNYLPQVEEYLGQLSEGCLETFKPDDFKLSPLAKGEYNLNYLVQSAQKSFVFRVNMGTQIERDDQITYEYNSLEILKNSGVTPIPYFLDDSKVKIDRGILIMEYLPGSSLDYRLDLRGAAKTFSIIHQLQIPTTQNHLIVEKKPLTLILKECKNLLATYFQSVLAQSDISRYLQEVVEKLSTQAYKESFYLEDPHLCIVNSEVNSGNFIVNRRTGTTHLIDWEMPRWGDPSTDLCHFCSPLTTLWKTDFQFTHSFSSYFLTEYKKSIRSRSLRNSLEDRMALKYPYIYLRGIAWSAMGWIMYQENNRTIRNNDTWIKLNSYMNLDFIRSIFDPYLKNSSPNYSQ